MHKKELIRSSLIFTAGLLIYYICYLLIGERSYSQIGLRWDPESYYRFTRSFNAYIANNNLTAYEFQRIFPAGIIHWAMRLLHIPFNRESVIAAWDVYTIFLMLSAVWVWFLICSKAKISNFGFWIGAIALFCNSAVLKIYLYQSITTDSTALLLGLLLVYAHLIKNRLMLAITILAASFTWPSAIFLGLVLLIGNSCAMSSIKRNTPETKVDVKRRIILSTLTALGPIAIILIFIFVYKAIMLIGTTPVLHSLLPISLLLLGMYCYLITNGFIARVNFNLQSVKTVFSQIKAVNVIGAILLLLLTRALILSFANSTPSGLTLVHFTLNITLSSITAPLKFLVTHTSYYGPIVLLFIFFWKRFADQLTLTDLGVVGFVAIHLFQAMGAESRQLIFGYPFLVFLLVQAIQDLKFKKSFVFVFLLTSLFFSRFWYPINQVPFPRLDLYDPGMLFQSFPWQNFAMFNGAWLSNTVYSIMLPIGVFTAAIYYFYYVRPALGQEHTR